MSDLAQTLIHPGALPSAQPGLPKRRRAARLTPDPLLVIGLPSGNRGLVLDISENGLGFLVGEPIDRAAREVRFTIAARSVKLCEAVGNFVWRDAAGQRARRDSVLRAYPMSFAPSSGILPNSSSSMESPVPARRRF